MQLQIIWTLEDFEVLDDLLTLQYSRPIAVSVDIRMALPDEGTNGGGQPDFLCISTAEFKPTKPFRQQLATLPATATQVDFYWFDENNQSELEAFLRGVEASTREIVEILRWRSGAGGKQNPLRFRSTTLQLSPGRQISILQAVVIRRMWKAPYAFGEDFVQELRTLLQEIDGAPIAHSLLREARDLWLTNPRSSLVLSVAAMELGAKKCITNISPDTTWILENLQSPPAISMIYHVLPPLIDRSGKSAYLPLDEWKSILQRAVESRNVLVHRPRGKDDKSYRNAVQLLSPLRLEEVHQIVFDLLWLFDFYAGHNWAVKRLTAKTKQGMIDRNGGKALPDLP